MDLRNTSLRGRNLHLKTITRDGWRFAGYGGARVRTSGMPDHLQVFFRQVGFYQVHFSVAEAAPYYLVEPGWYEITSSKDNGFIVVPGIGLQYKISQYHGSYSLQ